MKRHNTSAAAELIGAWQGDRLRQHYDFDMAVHESRFRLRFELQPVDNPPPLTYDRTVLVADGPLFIVNRFSERIRPLGREANAFNASPSDFAMATGVSLNPAELLKAMVGETANLRKGVMTREAGGGNVLLVRNVSEHYSIELEASPAVGFNVILAEARATGTGKSLSQYTADWRQAGDRWYISRLTRRQDRPGGVVKEEVEFSEAAFDPDVLEETFSFGALEPLERQRIIDHRRGANVKVRTVLGMTPKRLRGMPGRILEQFPDRYGPGGQPPVTPP